MNRTSMPAHAIVDSRAGSQGPCLVASGKCNAADVSNVSKGHGRSGPCRKKEKAGGNRLVCLTTTSNKLGGKVKVWRKGVCTLSFWKCSVIISWVNQMGHLGQSDCSDMSCTSPHPCSLHWQRERLQNNLGQTIHWTQEHWIATNTGHILMIKITCSKFTSASLKKDWQHKDVASVNTCFGLSPIYLHKT